MISSYRLGDLIFLELNNDDKYELIRDYPHSFGALYIHELLKNPSQNKLELIKNIVMNKLNNDYHLFPSDLKYSTLIHLRLGDVISGNMSHELMKRPISINELKEVVPNNEKVYIIGKCFFAKTSSNNYEECIKMSKEYLNDVILNFNGNYLDMGNADMDLLAGIICKTFIQGKGYFSKLITEIRKLLNKSSVELYKLSPNVINGEFVYF